MWFTAGPCEQPPTFSSSSFSLPASQPYSYSLRISPSSPNPPPQNLRNRALASAVSSAASPSSTSDCDLCGCGSGGGGGGGFLSWVFSAGSARAEEGRPAAASDWDAHGLAAGSSPVPLSRLDGAKRYKVSELNFVDRRAGAGDLATENNPLFHDLAALRPGGERPGGEYTRSQLLKELDAMAASGAFEQVSLQGRPKSDGTLGLTVSYAEAVWAVTDRLRCVNMGLIAPPDEEFQDMAARERIEYLRKQERDYVQRVRGAKPCILPEPVHEELLGMVKKQQGKMTSGLMRRITRRIEKWYQDEGFACAWVVSYGRLDADEVVCEVVEGEITKVEYRFQDKLGNIVEGNTAIPVIDRELPQQLRPGHIFSTEAMRQAFKNISSLGLFSNVLLKACPDESEGRDVVVQIKLQELETLSSQATAGGALCLDVKGDQFLHSFNLKEV